MAGRVQPQSGEGFSLGAAADFSQGIAALGGAVAQSSAMRAQASYQAKLGEINSRLANWQAQDAFARGGYEGNRAILKGNEVANEARGAQAAGGIDVNSGSALDVQNRSRTVGAMDALTIANNATREAFGYKVNAINSTASGQFAASSAQNQATNSLIAGGISSLAYGLKGADSIWGSSGKTPQPDQDYNFSGNPGGVDLGYGASYSLPADNSSLLTQG